MPENQNGGGVGASVLWCSMLLRGIKAKLVKSDKASLNTATQIFLINL